MNVFRIVTAGCIILALSGCQEIQGPAWSSDGQLVAHTAYARQGASGGFSTSIYITSPDAPDADGAAPKLIAANAAFPYWVPNASQLYFLGDRDAQGFYTKILRWEPGAEKPAVALEGVRATAMQLVAGNNGPLILISQGRDSKPGSPVRAEIWNVTDNKRINLGALGDLGGPALSANGKVLIFGGKPVDGHASLMGAELTATGVGEAKVIFPTPASPEPDAAGYVVHAFPNSERFLFYGPGMASVWTMTGRLGANKFARCPIPEGLIGPVMARVAEDGNSASLTMLHASPGKVFYESYRLDFAPYKWTKLETSADDPVGGIAVDPKSKKNEAFRAAWISPAGLALGDLAKPHWSPVTANQFLAASALYLKANDPVQALAMAMKAQEQKPPPENPEALNQALFSAYMANKNFDRAADIFEQSWLLEPVKPAGVPYLFSPASGLAAPAPEWVAAETKKMDELIANVPLNRMIPLLRDAFKARLKGEQRAALDAYKKAMDICADKASVGGARFLQGVCELELGEIFQAGEMFEQAARIEDFPQADCAAGMSAMCYLLHGKADSQSKAGTVLQLPHLRKSPLFSELNQLAGLLRGKALKEHGTTAEAVSADGGAHAWVEFDQYWIPSVSTRPLRMSLEEGKFVERRLGLLRMTASSIFTNKSPKPILRVARAVTPPKLSPSGAALAFTVNGDVFPAPDNFCDLIVLDLTGGVFNGNTVAATAGKTKSRQILAHFTWNTDAEIRTSGVEVDVFGGQKAFEKAVPVGGWR